MEVKIEHLKQIAKLSKLRKATLKKRNPERAYQGTLTKYELIYQIVFLRDAPYEKEPKTELS